MSPKKGPFQKESSLPTTIFQETCCSSSESRFFCFHQFPTIQHVAWIVLKTDPKCSTGWHLETEVRSSSEGGRFWQGTWHLNSWFIHSRVDLCCTTNRGEKNRLEVLRLDFQFFCCCLFFCVFCGCGCLKVFLCPLQSSKFWFVLDVFFVNP